ncbi:MAG TPA: glycosyltransferase family 39 protein [Polyangiales bacterium]|nr:glycosyltransferase family 39 protein [Polyangiales bacterium]
MALRIRESLRAQPYNVLGCALAMLYAVPSVWYPFGSDQGIHWYLGHALLHGQLPYVSGISGKPPLIFVVHAIAEAVFGNRQSSIRLLELVALPGFGALLARAVRRPARPARDGEVGSAALLLSAANFTYQDYWNTAHPEFWMTLCLVGAQCVAVREARPRRRALWVGVLCAIAFLLKYPAAAIAIPIAAYAGVRALYLEGYAAGTRVGWRADRAHWLALVREAGWFLSGAALVFAVVVAPFALTGNLRPMIEVCVYMTENYAGAVGFPKHWYRPLLDPSIQGTFFLSMLAIFVAGVVVTARKRDREELVFAAFLLSLVIAAVGSVVLQKRLFTYHWIASYAFFVGLGFWGARQVIGALRPSLAPRLLLSAAALWTLAAFFYQPEFITKVPHTYREHVASWSRVVFGGAPQSELTMNYLRVAKADRFGDLVRASEFVKSRAAPGDALCLTCFISPVYHLTGMRCTTRHAIGSFVFLGPRSWGSEYAQDLRERPPRFMVSIHTLPRRNKTLIKNGYREIARFGTVLVFERVAQDAASAERLHVASPTP